MNLRNDIKVFISSPYNAGDKVINVRRQIETANVLMDLGYKPYTPLMMHFQQMVFPRNEEDWMQLDLTFVKVCDALLRLKPVGNNGKEIPSPGADREEEEARKNNIPVFYTMQDLNVYFKSDVNSYWMQNKMLDL